MLPLAKPAAKGENWAVVVGVADPSLATRCASTSTSTEHAERRPCEGIRGGVGAAVYVLPPTSATAPTPRA